MTFEGWVAVAQEDEEGGRRESWKLYRPRSRGVPCSNFMLECQATRQVA